MRVLTPITIGLRYRGIGVLCLSLSLLLCSCGGGGSSKADPPSTPLSNLSVTTWHYDNARTGVNPNEVSLTSSNVNPNGFGELFTLPVDGAVIGATLYLGSVTVPGKGPHNVVYAATMHDSVYAFDADSVSGANSTPLWQVSLLPAGATPEPMSLQKCQTTTAWQEVGIVSTPVIDPATGTLYVAAKTLENGTPIFRLHALDVATGQEKLGGPVQLTASVSFNGLTNTFSALAETNRPALLLTNNHIYLAFGSNGCNAYGDQGWVLSYNATTLAQEGAFTTEPNTNLGSIWQKGGGLSADSSSNIYAEVAEGIVIPGTNFGSSVIKLSQSGTSLQSVDWFTAYNQAYLLQNDLDLNNSVLILPDQPGPYPHLAIAVGKEGTVYLLNRDNMGQYCFTCLVQDTQIPQELLFATGTDTGALIYWNSTIYSTGGGDPIREWSLQNGQLLPTPIAQTAPAGGGHSPVLTSNGNENGILWQLNGTFLNAYDASSLSTLYSSSQTNGRDALPSLPHFAQLTAINGKVYVSTNDSVVVFGLL